MRLFSALFAILALSACSIYRSDGRKFLETQAFEYAGTNAQSNLQGCQIAAPLSQWVQMSQTPLARIFVHDNDSFELRIQPTETSVDFSCDYQFGSAQEMFEKTSAAVDLTLSRLNQYER